jgi:TP901 family phage tail tape measure protein
VVVAEELLVNVRAQDQASDVLNNLQHMMENTGAAATDMGINMMSGASMGKVAIIAMGAAAAIALVYAIDQAADFEKEMQVVSAVSDVSGQALHDLGNEAMALGQSYGIAAEEVAGSLQVLGRAGVEAAVQMEVLNSAMEMSTMEGGSYSVEQSSENLVNTVKMYGDTLENASYYSDAFIHASKISTASIQGLNQAMIFAGGDAKMIGWEFKDLVAVFAALEEQGLRSDIAGTSVRSMLSLWTKETPKAEKGLSAIGLAHEDFIDASGKAKSPLESTKILYEALFSTLGSIKDNGPAWAQALNQIFPGAGGGKLARLFTGMEEGKGILENYTDKMHENYDASKDIETVQASLSMTWNRTTTAFNNLMIKIGQGFLPILTVLVGGFEKLFGFLSTNEVAVTLLTGALTLLAAAGLAVALAWSKNMIVNAVSAGYDLLLKGVRTLIGEKTFETAAIEANTLAWEKNVIAQQLSGQGISVGRAGGKSVGMPLFTPVGQTGGRAGGLAQKALGALGTFELLGSSIPVLIPVLIAIAAAAAGVYLWFNHLDGVYERVGKKVEELRGDEKRLTDRLHEQREALKGVKEGTKAYDDLNAALQVTQQELDKVIDKIYQQNAAMYAAEASDPRKMLSAESGATEPMILQQAGSGPFGIGVGFVQQGIGQSLGYSSNVIGAQEEYLQSYQKWATPTVEHQLQAAYKYMSDASNLALLQKQKDNPNSLTDEDKRNIEQIDNYLKGIVGKDNVKGAKDMYFAELKLAEARKKLDDAMGRLWMSVINLVLAFFGLGGETTDETGKQKDLGAQMSETADKINKASEKVYKLIDAIDQFIKNVDWWIQELQGKHPDTPQETQAKNVLNTGQPNANPSTNVVGIPNVPTTPVWDPLAQIRQNSPLVISKGKPGQLNQGTTEIRLPDVDPDRFAKERAETKKALLSKGGGGNNYTIIVYANTKKDADAVGQKVRETLENLNK